MFSSLTPLPKDQLFLLYNEYLKDPNPQKVNLGIGLYMDDQGDPYVFPSVQKAMKEIDTTNCNYDPISGNKEFLDTMGTFLFGKTYFPSSLAIQQTCGGSHGLSMMAHLFRQKNKKTLLVGTPTWENYSPIFHDFHVQKFSHLDDTGAPNVTAYQKAVQEAPNGSILLLQGESAHNPTGVNLSFSEIASLLEEIQKKEMFVLIDFAYLGLGDDLATGRNLSKQLLETFQNIAFVFSFSKNASLYKHRLGVLCIKSNNPRALESHLEKTVRQTISTPPGFGAEVMNSLFKHSFEPWKTELEAARMDLIHRRNLLVQSLSPSFSFLKKGRGLFGMSGLSPENIKHLQEKHAIYLPNSGRINFGGLPVEKIPYIADCIQKCL